MRLKRLLETAAFFFWWVCKKYPIPLSEIGCYADSMNDIFVLTGISEGEKARLTRLAKGLRQIDLASLAKVNVCDITALEKDRYVLHARRNRILVVLGLSENDDENNQRNS